MNKLWRVIFVYKSYQCSPKSACNYQLITMVYKILNPNKTYLNKIKKKTILEKCLLLKSRIYKISTKLKRKSPKINKE